MALSKNGFKRQLGTWQLLKGLHPRAIDLSRIELIRDATLDSLSDPAALADLIPRLGLNDEGLEEFPEVLRSDCGLGLLIWQLPLQFAPFLATLSALGVRSYLEIGIRHGGSFVATAEFLDRFNPLDFAVGVDIIPCPSMADYHARNPRSRFVLMDSQSPEFAALIQDLAPIDLVFIDSHHVEEQCRAEVALLSRHCNMIALHDIANPGCPGVGVVWRELREQPDWVCFEFVQQYPGNFHSMGIGLAVRTSRLPPNFASRE